MTLESNVHPHWQALLGSNNQTTVRLSVSPDQVHLEKEKEVPLQRFQVQRKAMRKRIT
jgi:hypothetical protein